MRLLKDTMWAISGTWDNRREFLYTGTYLTRRDAIKDHCEMTGRTWSKSRAMGERAVKVELRWMQSK